MGEAQDKLFPGSWGPGQQLVAQQNQVHRMAEVFTARTD